MHDLIIRGGTVIDGSGLPRQRADVAIRDGVVVAVDTRLDLTAAAETIDADGQVIAPGFVDIHTHYDAQVMWDPAATPSVLHGVTTIVGGNCGFSLAPLVDQSADYVVPMLATVEGIPEEALRSGLEISWRSFEEYLARLEGTLVVNAGFLVGHSAVRRAVMGDASVGGTADADQVREMAVLVHQSIRDGALGFSTSRSQAHIDHNGDPVPSRHAPMSEVLTLCRAAGEHDGTSLEGTPGIQQEFSEADALGMVAMSLAARRPLNWNSLTLEQGDAVRASRLAASDIAAAAGGRVVGLAPCHFPAQRFSLKRPFLWESIPGWGDTMRLPLPERVRRFAMSDVRGKLRQGAEQLSRRWVDWGGYVIHDVANRALQDLVGSRIEDLAAARGQDPFDVFCDVAVADGLLTGFAPRPVASGEDGWRQLVELCRDPRVVVGATDAGAHLDMISNFAMYTTFLAQAVRERELVSLEEAVHLLCWQPAALYGLKGRGSLRPGDRADAIIFDPDSIDAGNVEVRCDLPAGAERCFSSPTGIRAVIVNGAVVVHSGELTGRTPGQVVRSGADTDTPSIRLPTVDQPLSPVHAASGP
jgi:N-acyl-D-aspartate/D-glutamate deacylase